MSERTCISYWLPKLQAAGIPTPRTEIIPCDFDLSLLLDGKTPEGFDDWLGVLSDAVFRMGTPCFLRTGQGSGKHNWRNTCYVADRAKLASHVASLVEWSHTVDFLGLPHDVWAVREMLPTSPVAVLDAYGNMPLVPEWRGFVRDGKVVCVHFYWPAKAICQGFRSEPPNIGDIIEQSRCGGWIAPEATRLLDAAAIAFDGDGAWSVDVLQTRRGYFVTDMAEAARSWHWPGCEHAESFKSKEAVHD